LKIAIFSEKTIFEQESKPNIVPYLNSNVSTKFECSRTINKKRVEEDVIFCTIVKMILRFVYPTRPKFFPEF